MKYLFSLALVLSVSGCSFLPDKDVMDFEEKKVTLERDIELLTLKKRKAILEKQLDAIHDADLQIVPVIIKKD